MASRRTISGKKAAKSQSYRKARSRTNKSHSSPNGATKISRSERASKALDKELTLHGLKRPSRPGCSEKERALEILHCAGVSMSIDRQRTSRKFSLVKTQTDDTIVRNPMILDMTTYTRLPKNPILTKSVLKNPNNSFYTPDPKLTYNQKERYRKQKTKRAPDTIALANKMLEKSLRSPNRQLRGLSFDKTRGT